MGAMCVGWMVFIRSPMKVIIITDLYSAFRSESTEALDAAQEDQVSLNRWVFKWRLKVRIL